MTQEEFEDLQGRIFSDTGVVKSTHRRQVLPKRSATITRVTGRDTAVITLKDRQYSHLNKWNSFFQR